MLLSLFILDAAWGEEGEDDRYVGDGDDGRAISSGLNEVASGGGLVDIAPGARGAAAPGGKPVVADDPTTVGMADCSRVGNVDWDDRMDVCIGISVAAIKADRLGECEGGGSAGTAAGVAVRSGIEDSASALERGDERYAGGGVSALRVRLAMNAKGPFMTGGVGGAVAVGEAAAPTPISATPGELDLAAAGV